ncbi:membrane protein YqaA with SNARE-associated domain [Tepidamorphus gemmatus]|uniref:Membrane protein YqaA with SNARE-associated domain n=1 Tax=Tepidamorphus gemmatus TaxID=747076 RepID=A0A4R3MLI4_9HYPH|nr:YqaA family protein [Tepidamorphus gemmatus]TCT13290.1 membrane protein YqaA with SNARE-associated domain [Tepidamorphus gemmatus]
MIVAVEDLVSLLGLFVVALVAATLLPAQSEVALAGLLAAGDQPVVAPVIMATAGNVVGSTLNWLLGRGIEQFRNRRWFPVSERALQRAIGWYGRWGRWSLLLSWVPVVGDPLTLAAGVLREPFWSFLALVTVAKAGRYMVVTAATLGVL